MAIDFVEDPERWIRAWKAVLDESPTYEEAAAGWGVDFDGSLVMEVRPDDRVSDPPSFYVDPVDGEIRSVRVTREPRQEDAAFRLSAPFDRWRALIQGEVDPATAVAGGGFSFDGDLLTVMQYRRAATIMTVAATAVDTEFPDPDPGPGSGSDPDPDPDPESGPSSGVDVPIGTDDTDGASDVADDGGPSVDPG